MSDRSKTLADLLLLSMPKKVAPVVIRSIVNTIYEIKAGNLSFDDLPDSRENFVLLVCGVIAREMVESKKDDEETVAAKERFRKFMEGVLK